MDIIVILAIIIIIHLTYHHHYFSPPFHDHYFNSLCLLEILTIEIINIWCIAFNWSYLTLILCPISQILDISSFQRKVISRSSSRLTLSHPLCACFVFRTICVLRMVSHFPRLKPAKPMKSQEWIHRASFITLFLFYSVLHCLVCLNK